MPDLGVQAIRTWCRSLPADVRGVVTDEIGGDDGRIRTMVARLEAAPLQAAAGIIREFDRDVAAMGRPRRVRLLAWLAARIDDDSQIRHVLKVFDEEGDGEAGEADARPTSCRLFFEDVRLLAQEVVAPRKARSAIDPSALDLVTRSSMAVAVRSGPTGGAP